MLSSVLVASASASGSSARRRSSSSTGALGNFGARPHPPYTGSKLCRSPRRAAESKLSVSGSVDGLSEPECRTASTSCAAERVTSSRVPVHRVVGVLEQVRARLTAEAIHA
jgi:hypothetical protein